MRKALLASVFLLLACVVTGDPRAPLGLGGAVEPDAKIQDALARMIGGDRPIDLRAVHDLAKLTEVRNPDDKRRDLARQHLAEQLFLHAVKQRLSINGYELFRMKNAMRILQGTLFIRNSDYVIAAAPNVGHENRVVGETATDVLAFLDAFTPVKDKLSGTYHFRELEPYLERVQRLDFALDEGAPRLILAMYHEDPDAGLNTIFRIIRRRARNVQELRALPDLREERECVARVRFIRSVGVGSEAAAAMKPGAQECLIKLAESPHWYVRLYVPFVFVQEGKLLDRALLDRLGADDEAIVRSAVGNVRDALQQREAIRRQAEEQYGGDK